MFAHSYIGLASTWSRLFKTNKRIEHKHKNLPQSPGIVPSFTKRNLLTPCVCKVKFDCSTIYYMWRLHVHRWSQFGSALSYWTPMAGLQQTQQLFSRLNSTTFLVLVIVLAHQTRKHRQQSVGLSFFITLISSFLHSERFPHRISLYLNFHYSQEKKSGKCYPAVCAFNLAVFNLAFASEYFNSIASWVFHNGFSFLPLLSNVFTFFHRKINNICATVSNVAWSARERTASA